MPILDSPKIDYIPSSIEAVRKGFRRGSQPVPSEEKIQAIEENPEAYIAEYSQPKPPTWTNEYGVEILRVPQTTFWYVDNDTFIGEIAVRHQLNDYLLNRNGHIGYGVRPDMASKGYATNMLKLALDFSKNTLLLDKVLITTDDTNIASSKVIEKNGGILEDIRVYELNNTLYRRYWITL